MYKVFKELLNWWLAEKGKIYTGRIISEMIDEVARPPRLILGKPPPGHATNLVEIKRVEDLVTVDPTGRLIADFMEIASDEMILSYKSQIKHEKLLEKINQDKMELMQKKEMKIVSKRVRFLYEKR